jgi:nucleotide-binding universal stress UspA family protein
MVPNQFLDLFGIQYIQMLISGYAERLARTKLKRKATMISLKKVLLPVKLPKQPDQINSLIEALGIGIHDEIHVIYVAPIIPYSARFPFPSSYRKKIETNVVLRSEKRLKVFLKGISKNRNLKSIVALGDPSRQILKYAQTAQIDLIVMRGRKKYGFERLFLGSVVEQVVKESPIPVFAIISNIEYVYGTKGKKTQNWDACNKTSQAVLEHILYVSRVFNCSRYRRGTCL